MFAPKLFSAKCLHTSMAAIVLLGFGSSLNAAPCIAPDFGGTVNLPAPCPYESIYGDIVISAGLPANTTIEIDASLDNFININEIPGGSLGGTLVDFDAVLLMPMYGTGALAGFIRNMQMQVHMTFATAPRTPGDPVQDFPTEMVQLQGQIFGDPDFDFLQIQGGSSFGHPSPGNTRLDDLGPNFNVESFFDVEYEITFQGAPGSVLDGMSGSTQGTVRLQQGDDYWQPGDGHKMHFPQLPDEEGWNVNSSFPSILADDWQCSETGFVKDLHFWGSWQRAITGIIDSFTIRIYSDIPAGTDLPYSHPGDQLWEHVFTNYGSHLIQPGLSEGWYDPLSGLVVAGDHDEYWQYDIVLPEPLWFRQEFGTIYWLSITAHVDDPALTHWGWKSSLDHFNDDAVFGEMIGNPCVVPGPGGTVILPADCPIFSPNGTYDIIDGLPPATAINSVGIIDNFANKIAAPGGTLGGEVIQFDAVLQLQMTGSGALAGFNRLIGIPIFNEWHIGPRTPGDPVQDFDTDYFVLQGQIFGDPDFDQLQITAGTGFGHPSPGHMTLTDNGGGTFTVDSFFDIEYRIDFIGAPGSVLDGLSGSTVGTVHVQQGQELSVWIEMYEPPTFGQSMDLSFVITGETPICCDLPGDFNDDGSVDISDLTAQVDYMFSGGPGPVCLEEGDHNGDCSLDIADLTYMVDYLFGGGPAPVPCNDCP